MLKQLPSGLYFVVLILFFTPWWSAGCADQKALKLTGVQIATGFDLDTIAGFNPTLANPFGIKTETKTIPPEPLVVATSLLTLGALIVGLKTKRRSLFAAGAMGFVAALLLLVFKARVDAKVLKEGNGLVLSIFENGFWATFVVLLITSVSQLLWAKQMEPEYEVLSDSAPIHKPVQDNASAVHQIKHAKPFSTEPPPAKPQARGKLIPTEPPPIAPENNPRYMPPSMRRSLEDQEKRERQARISRNTGVAGSQAEQEFPADLPKDYHYMPPEMREALNKEESEKKADSEA